MSNLPYTYNVQDLPEDTYKLIQPGSYAATIVGADMKETKNRDGEYLELEIQTSEGILFERLNLVNKNDKAVDIANRTLRKIFEASGVTGASKTEHLIGAKFMVDVEIEKGKPYMKDGMQKEGNDQNRIKRYHPAGGAVPATATSGAAVPPWKK